MVAPLTARQAEALGYIADYIATHGFPPSSRELARDCGLGCASGAHRMLVLLENKGYLTRDKGLSRAMSVVAQPPVAPSDLGQQDSVLLLTLNRWLSDARDAELVMAARTVDLETKSTLMEMACERQEQIRFLRPILSEIGSAAKPFIDVPQPIVPLGHPTTFALMQYLSLMVRDELLGTLPRSKTWEVFVIDELVCNRVSFQISKYVSGMRPGIRGLLWRHVQLSEKALERSQQWTNEILASQPGGRELDDLTAIARELGQAIHTTAKGLEARNGDQQSLLSNAFDPDQVVMLA